MENVDDREKFWSWRSPVVLVGGKICQEESMDMENTTSHLVITCRSFQRAENIPVSQSAESASSAAKFRSYFSVVKLRRFGKMMRFGSVNIFPPSEWELIRSWIPMEESFIGPE
jgi:hypothetical protein